MSSSDDDDYDEDGAYHYSSFKDATYRHASSNTWPFEVSISAARTGPLYSPSESSHHSPLKSSNKGASSSYFPYPTPPGAFPETSSSSEPQSPSSSKGKKHAAPPKARDNSPPQETILSEEETEHRINYWEKRAEAGGFDADIHIIDPLAYQSHLKHTEDLVMESSEFSLCQGEYRCNDNTLPNLSIKDNWLPNMAKSLRKKIPQHSGRQESRRILESLWKSYILLCRTMMTFEKLKLKGFSTSFYSMLAQQASRQVARMIRINETELKGLKTGLEDAIMKIFDGGYGAGPVLTTYVATHCHQVFGSTALLPRDTRAAQNTTLTLLRMTVILLDLAMVSYVGCHWSPFPSAIGSDSETIEIQSDSPDIPSFQCSLKKLACLSEFLDNKRVWVFESREKHTSKTRQERQLEGISILARMEEFSDVWGPVWPVRLSSNRIRQYNLSRGCIRKIASGAGHSENEVKCHWDPSSSIPRTRAKDVAETKLSMEMNDLLLIGGALHENDNCAYTRTQFENKYGMSMKFPETISPTWKLEARSAGISAGQFVALNMTGTQKKIPGITLKENIYNKLSHSPQNVNPCFLNQFLGVEISHCTGNARRMRFRDLLCLESVKHRLNQMHSGWEQTHWGKLFSDALSNSDPNAIHNLYRDHRDIREEIGKFLTPLLELLRLTGHKDNTLVAAFLAEFEDRHMEIESRGNEWGICLGDSDRIATYAVIGGKCLTKPRGTCAACLSEPSETVYETGIVFDEDLPSIGDNIQLNPGGNILEVQQIRGKNNRIILSPRTAQTRILHLRTITAQEIVGNIPTDRKIFNALIKASNKSYGGMKQPRQAIRVQGQPARSQKPRPQIAPTPQVQKQQGKTREKRRKRRKQDSFRLCVIL